MNISAETKHLLQARQLKSVEELLYVYTSQFS